MTEPWVLGDPTPHQHAGSTDACFCEAPLCECGHHHLTGDDEGADGGCERCDCLVWRTSA